MIDIEKAKTIFKEYVSNYDPSNPRIALKIAHTYRVSETAKSVAKTIYNKSEFNKKFTNEENIELAELIGLLHDIGRFEQLKRFDSFSDRETIDHAKYGVEVLTRDDNKLLKKFCPDEKYYDTIIIAIRNHNKYRIEKDLLNDDIVQCNIIRDADKIDIMNLVRTEKMKTLYKKDEIDMNTISKNVYDDFIKNVQTNRDEIKNDIDDWILTIGMIFDINYLASFKIIYDNKYVDELLDRVENQINKTEIENIRKAANQYLQSKIN